MCAWTSHVNRDLSQRQWLTPPYTTFRAHDLWPSYRSGACALSGEEGVGAFFKGAGSNILRGLGGTLVLVGFDYFKKFYIKAKYGVDVEA